MSEQVVFLFGIGVALCICYSIFSFCDVIDRNVKTFDSIISKLADRMSMIEKDIEELYSMRREINESHQSRSDG